MKLHQQQQDQQEDQQHTTDDIDGDILSCRIIGFYPSPTGTRPKGIEGWIMKDIHQAIIIESKSSSSSHSKNKNNSNPKLFIDFMTKNGVSHPVWYNENVKWSVLLGGSIEGEVRIKLLETARSRNQRRKQQQQQKQHQLDRNTFNILQNNNDESEINSDDDYNNIDKDITLLSAENKAAATASSSLPTTTTFPNSKMEEIVQIANSYNTNMNLYRNNCRIFCATMEREVERINNNDTHQYQQNQQQQQQNNYITTPDNKIELNDQSQSHSQSQPPEMSLPPPLSQSPLSTITTTSSSLKHLIFIECRFFVRCLLAVLLPALYPLTALLMIYEGVVRV